MSQHSTASRRELPPDIERFRFEDTEAFEKALELAILADQLAMEHRKKRPWLGFQLGKTGVSVLNNTGEAIGEYSRGDKARFFRYALRSASELGAMIVFMGERALLTVEAEGAARGLTLDVMKMLGRKAIHFQRRARRGER
jgi:four helix bundle protein